MAIRKGPETERDFAEGKLHKWRGLILIAVLFVAALAGLILWKHVRIRIELARIRAAGEPVTPEDLSRMYVVPEGENDTTELWLAAILPFGARGYWDDVRGIPLVDGKAGTAPLPGQPWPTRNIAEAVLQQYDRCLSDLHQAAKADGAARFVADFEDGLGTLLPHVPKLRPAAQLLRLEARVGAHQGNATHAAASIEAIFSVAQAVRREPIQLSHLLRISCNGYAVSEVEKLLGRVDFSDTQLNRFQSRLRAANYEEGLYRAMLGERVLGIAAIRDPSTAGLTRWRGMLWRVFSEGDLRDYLDFWRRVIEAAKGPWPRALERIAEIEAGLPAPDAQDPSSDGSGSLFRPVAPLGEITPARGWLMRRFERTARATALNRAADAAIAVERFRRRHGGLPERLQELVPEFLPNVPDDPFSGEPMRYAQEANGFVVYSVGMNGSNGGGRTDEIDMEHSLSGDTEEHPADFVFRVRRAPVSSQSEAEAQN